VEIREGRQETNLATKGIYFITTRATGEDLRPVARQKMHAAPVVSCRARRLDVLRGNTQGILTSYGTAAPVRSLTTHHHRHKTIDAAEEADLLPPPFAWVAFHSIPPRTQRRRTNQEQ